MSKSSWNKFIKEFKTSLSQVDSGLILVSFIFALFLTSCTEIIFRGDEEQMFLDTSIKRLNIPLWLYGIGMITYLVGTISSLLLRTFIQSRSLEGLNLILKPKELIIIKLVMFLNVAFFIGLLAALAFLMEIFNNSFFFSTFLTLEVLFIVLAILAVLIRLGKYFKILDVDSKFFDSLTQFFNKVTKKINNTIGGNSFKNEK